MALKICLACYSLRYPKAGGYTWMFINWALGIKAIGIELIWLDSMLVEMSDENKRACILQLRDQLSFFGIRDIIVMHNDATKIEVELPECKFDDSFFENIDLFINSIYQLMEMTTLKDKMLLRGILDNFEESINENLDLLDKFERLKKNPYLIKKYNNNQLTIEVLSMIYLIYDYNMANNKESKDILLNFSYFLINRFKNINYATYLCSKIKFESHKLKYLKFILLEEIEEYQCTKLNSSDSNKNKETIKTLQIGSVILYNIYCNIIKERIFEAICNQLDYFDTLKQINLNKDKMTKLFLKKGQKILDLRRDILKLWNKIIELNPFSDEIYNSFYYFYIKHILQDSLLTRNEHKKYNNEKLSKISE